MEWKVVRGTCLQDGALLSCCVQTPWIFFLLLLSLLTDSHVGFLFLPQGAARNPEDMDRERREHEREERMGQLRGSATRALPPGPPAGATGNRLRNVAEPMASTPTSRIQQSGEQDGRAGRMCAAPVHQLHAITVDRCCLTFLCLNRKHVPQSNLESGQGAEGQHEVTSRSSCQRLLIRPHREARSVTDFSITGEPLPGCSTETKGPAAGFA